MKCKKELWALSQKSDDRKQDCYDDKECRKTVDLADVAKVKQGFFMRTKLLKMADGGMRAIKRMLTRVHSKLVE